MPVDKSESRVRWMFSEIAPRYDLLNHLLSLNVDRYWRRKAARLAPVGVEGPILDVCTGTGDLALAYDRAVGGAAESGDPRRARQIVGVDFAHPMLIRAADKCRRAGADGRIGFVEADAQHLPLPDDHFALVTVAFGLRNITDTDRGLGEMVRVCRSGGRVMVLEFSQSRGPLKALYNAYFKYLLPWIGRLVSGSRNDAYNYLPQSVREFPSGAALAERMRAAGLRDVTCHRLTFGIATVYVGTK